MAKTSWVIMKETTYPAFRNVRSVHMIGFRSKREAMNECDRLNERSVSLLYTIDNAKVFQPHEP
jgi:hypothetical protein